MAGVKGRSGGARPNTGGARPGAGRPPKEKPPVALVDGDKDMLQLLMDVALGRIEVTPTQLRAAIAAVQYTHLKSGDGGKKQELEKKAEKAAAGKFSPKAPPRLIVSNNG
jgi:phage terminase small subunit